MIVDKHGSPLSTLKSDSPDTKHGMILYGNGNTPSTVQRNLQDVKTPEHNAVTSCLHSYPYCLFVHAGGNRARREIGRMTQPRSPK